MINNDFYAAVVRIGNNIRWRLESNFH